MKSELISLDTAQKLANRDKAIKYCKNILDRKTSGLTEIYIENILRILEGKK